MTSVQNHRLLLSGSKIFLIGLIFFSMTSCALFKKAETNDKVYQTGDELDEIQGKVVFNPQTGEYEKVNSILGKLDTVHWVDKPKDIYRPITSSTKFDDFTLDNPQNASNSRESIMKTDYEVTYVLPFLSNKYNPSTDKINKNSNWALQYYAGARLAFEQLNAEGINLHVHVFDSEASTNKVNELIATSQALQNSDLIIGPYKRKNITLLADFAKKNNITMVSPHSAGMNLTTENFNYIQVNPSLKAHCQAITENALKHFTYDQIVLCVRNKPEEIQRLRYFQDALHEITGNDSIQFKQYIITDNTADFSQIDVLPHLFEDKTTVFIVPSWSNKTFIYSLLRNLSVARAQNNFDIAVYGMPQWMRYDDMDFDFYENFSLRVSNSFYIDEMNANTQNFKRNYYERYHIIPTKSAYLGYDETLFFGKMLQKYGTKFQNEISKNEYKSIFSTYKIKPIIKKTDLGVEIEQFENKFLHILKYENFYFQNDDL